MSYMIAILRKFYMPLRPVKFYYEGDDPMQPNYYETIAEAQEQIDIINDDVYVTSNGEAGRPDYVIVDDDAGDYILSGRGGDGGNYNWEDCECTRNNGDCCGECDNCLHHMIDDDIAFINRSSKAGLINCDHCNEEIEENNKRLTTKLGKHFCSYDCLESFYCDEVPENEDFLVR